MKNFNLQKAIGYASGKEVRVNGGLGLSKDDPVLITETHHSLAVELERFVAKEVSVFYGFWNAEIQSVKLLDYDGKKIDEFSIGYEDGEGESQEAKLYFDISSGYSNIGKTLEQVKTKDELDQIYGNIYHKDHERVEHFYSAVYWALHKENEEADDVETLLCMFGLESEELAVEIHDKLKECGL